MTYDTLVLSNNLLSNIPVVLGSKQMDSDLYTTITLLQVSYQREITKLDEFMQDVVKKLKKEGFDNRAAKQKKREDIERRISEHDNWQEGQKDAEGDEIPRPAMPSDEEINDAKEIEKDKDAYDKELDELNKAYQKAYMEKMEQEAPKLPKMSRDQYVKLVSFVGLAGDIEYKGIGMEKPTNLDRRHFLTMIAFNVVEY